MKRLRDANKTGWIGSTNTGGTVVPEMMDVRIKTFMICKPHSFQGDSNPFHGLENENPHAHINSFKRITSTLRFRNVPNDVIKLMMFPYSLEGAAKTWENVSKMDERIDKLADQLSTLVEIVPKGVTPAPVKAVEENCVTCGGAHAWYNCPATDNNQNVCATTGTYNQQAPPNRVSNQMAPPGFARCNQGPK
ncbi:hypothetical protein Tco_0707633 [Tanacetum coccineum]|uniref:Reverse transcriptase domain-containing protein n=1 Tax=Tanacetum coccineum TaxID=301880 RepID=A0ABQ4YBL6_9ASTR